MNAVILAGGKGSRLAPLTLDVPKPLLPVANKPMMEYCINTLLKAKINRISVTLSYKAEMIAEYCRGLGGIDFSFSVEEVPLGTAGGVKAAKTDDVFVVMSGDGLTDIDLTAMIEYHYSMNSDVTIAVTPSRTPWLYGVAEVKNGYVCSYTEKPLVDGERTVNTGIYVVNKKVLSLVDGRCDFSKDLFPKLLKDGKIAAYTHGGYWSDIGDFRSYYRSNFDAKNGLVGGRSTVGNLCAKNAYVYGYADNCIISSDCVVDKCSHINGCVVLPRSCVKNDYRNCIIAPDAVIPIT